MKCAIYLRTSTTEQNPDNQKAECLEYAKNKGYEVSPDHIFVEQLSAYKNIERPKYEEVKILAKTSKIKAVIVWAIDRWVRNKSTLLYDATELRNYGCKLHSVKEPYLETINIDGPFGETINDLLLGLVGSMAQIESQRKSERVKIAFQNHKGKKWGRPKTLKEVDDWIIELFLENKSIRQIKKLIQYHDRNKKEKGVSVGYVHKCISEYRSKLVLNQNLKNEVQESFNL